MATSARRRLTYEGEETYRSLIASNLTWRTLDTVQGHALRWFVKIFVQDWTSAQGGEGIQALHGPAMTPQVAV